MDFFEAQARAKQRTSRLVLLFALAVVGTIAAGYLATAVILRQGNFELRNRGGDYRFQRATGEKPPLWQPRLFAGVALGTIAVVGLASLAKWTQYRAGGGTIAESVGGRLVPPDTTDLDERRLLNVVEEMAIASGTPVPAVYVLKDEVGINAFAAGLTPNDAAIAVTRGAVEKLTRDELQGVIGHEFSHILNGDMRLNVRIAATVFGILVLGLAGRTLLWSLRHTRARRGRNAGGVIAGLAAIGLVLLLVGYIGYFFGRLIQAAVSRQREYLADASAVQFTRNPGAVAGALKKIGGYALGSRLNTSKAAAIGHFFFAQAFRSGLTGWWSTHPPLDERIRAIEPDFDGRMFEPPQKVDVTRESFRQVAARSHALDESLRRAFAAPIPADAPPARIPFQPDNAIASVGTISPSQLADAQALLEALPPRARAAAHDPHGAAALLCALLLADDPALRAHQRTILVSGLGADAARRVAELEPELPRVDVGQKLPLVQLAVAALRRLPYPEIEKLLGTLDELVHADAHVCTFEFALQKLVARALQLGRNPAAAGAQIQSFRAVEGDIAVVLSTLARTATRDAGGAERAFLSGRTELPLIADHLLLLDPASASLAALDAALDRLAAASPPIKQRTLFAAAKVVGADGHVALPEAELLRAISAALDCPMPLPGGLS